MSIEVMKCRHYGAAPESLLEDGRLDLDTRAVAAWLATRASDSQIEIDHICQQLGVGKSRWRKIANQLADNGYLTRTQTHDICGKWVWIIEFDALGG